MAPPGQWSVDGSEGAASQTPAKCTLPEPDNSTPEPTGKAMRLGPTIAEKPLKLTEAPPGQWTTSIANAIAKGNPTGPKERPPTLLAEMERAVNENHAVGTPASRQPLLK